MPYKNPADKARRNRRYYERRKRYIKARNKAYGFRYRDRIKREVLTHYGKTGRLQCRWRRCTIIDVDMLTIDHVNNDGQHRKVGYRGSGYPLYRALQIQGYPEGFQTLCCNHQFKKELTRKRRAAQRDKDESDVSSSDNNTTASNTK